MTRTQPWMAVAATVAFMALPVVASTENETRFNKEWSPTPAVLAPAGQQPTASLAPQRPTDIPFSSAQETPNPLALHEADYQRVNPTVHTD